MRLCVIGIGAIGVTHLATIARTPGVELVGVADPSPTLPAIAAAYSTRAYANFHDLLTAERPQGAILAVPNALHLPIGLALLQAGVPVLMEKPVASTVAEGMALAAMAQQTGVPVLVGHHRRHHPAVRMARKMVADGALGRVVTVSVTSNLMKPDAYFGPAWRSLPGVGGPLLINAIHEIDLLRCVVGEIDEVMAMSSSAIRGFAVEDTAAVIFRFQGGALATLALSDTAAAPWAWDLSAGDVPRFPSHDIASHLISGTEAALSLPGLDLWRHNGPRDWTIPMTATRITVERADPFVAQLQHFVAVIEGRERPLIDAREGSVNLAVMQAILASARSGQAQRVSDHDA